MRGQQAPPKQCVVHIHQQPNVSNEISAYAVQVITLNTTPTLRVRYMAQGWREDEIVGQRSHGGLIPGQRTALSSQVETRCHLPMLLCLRGSNVA